MEKIYDSLVGDNEPPIKFEYVPHLFPNIKYLKFKNHSFPWSIVPKEFSFLYETIVGNNLKKGFEACTGIGMSALAAGMAMKITEGKIVTIDSYIEERLNTDIYDSNLRLEKIIESDGYKNIQYLIKKHSLQNNLIAEIGWSPEDIPSLIEKNYNEPLDYVFIDSAHNEEQLMKEIIALTPYSDKNTHWLFHDIIPTLWTTKIQNYCIQNFNKRMKVVLPESMGCSNLGILE
jgi:hypothetical protein